MEKIELKFKNVGRYLESKSSRYEAKVNENFTIRIEAIYGMFGDGFFFNFITNDGYLLNTINTDFLSSYWHKATKADCISYVTDVINDKECFDTINLAAINYSKFMKK